MADETDLAGVDAEERSTPTRAVRFLLEGLGFIVACSVIVIAVLLPKFTAAAHEQTAASHESKEASDRAAAASDRAAAAAERASSDLAAAIAASQNPQLVAAFQQLISDSRESLIILCSADDPVRQKVCADYGIVAPPGGG